MSCGIALAKTKYRITHETFRISGIVHYSDDLQNDSRCPILKAESKGYMMLIQKIKGHYSSRDERGHESGQDTVHFGLLGLCRPSGVPNNPWNISYIWDCALHHRSRKRKMKFFISRMFQAGQISDNL